MNITVLIPAHNEEKYIEQAVRSVATQSAPPARILVVADACTDRTVELAKAAGADVIEVNERCKPKALNNALWTVTTEYTALLDADSEYREDFLAECHAAMTEHGYGGVCTAVDQLECHGIYQRSRAIEWASTHRMARRVESWHNWVAVLSGMAGMYRTEALRDVGGWPEQGLCEDVDLAIKMNAAGHTAGFVSSTRVFVRDPDTLKVYRKQIHRWSAGWAQAIQMNKRLFGRKYGFSAVFGALVFDSALIVSAWYSLLQGVVLGHVAQFNMVSWFGWWYVAITLITVGMASKQLGIRKAAACYPAYVLVSSISTTFGLWVMFREWVIGRHLVSWTGRQGRGAQFIGRKAWKAKTA